MSKNNLIQIGGELFNSVGDGIIADAAAVKDYTEGKTQATINAEMRASVPQVVSVGSLNAISSVGNYLIVDGDGNTRGYLVCALAGPSNSPFFLQTYIHDGSIYSRSGNALPLTGEWVNTVVQPSTLAPIQSAIDSIEAVIPSAASAQNQLADKNYVDTHSNDVDDALSTTSENPVQNKVVKAALDETVKNKGSESNIVVGVGNSSNIGITSSSIGMETGNSAILIGNDITLNTSGAVNYNGSRVATATDLQGKQDVIRDLQTIRDGAAAGATAYQKPQAGIPKTDLASAVQTSLGKADTAVQPAAMNTALAAKQDTLTFDNAPTANSNNPVKSGGVKTAIDAKQDTISTVNVTVDNNTGTPSGSASVSGGTLSLSFQNLKGAQGQQGPQGIQGVQGVQGPKGDTGVTGDASSLAIIHGIDKTSSYGTTDVCGADAAQALFNEIEGGFYY